MALVIWMKISKTVGFFYLFRYLYTVYRVRLQPYIFTFIFKATFLSILNVNGETFWKMMENEKKCWQIGENFIKQIANKNPTWRHKQWEENRFLSTVQNWIVRAWYDLMWNM